MTKTTLSNDWPKRVTVSDKTGKQSVSIYRRTLPGGSFNFQVADTSKGGRRLVSFSTEAEAVTEAERLATHKLTGNAIGAKMTVEDCASYSTSIQTLPSGCSLTKAAQIVADCHTILGNVDLIVEACRLYKDRDEGGLVNKTVSDAVTEFKKDRKTHGASLRYEQDISYRLKRLETTFKCNVGDISSFMLQKFFDEEGFTGQSHRNWKTVLFTFFEYCQSRRHVRNNPMAKIKTVKVDSGEIEIFTPTEISRLLHAALEKFPEFVPALAFGAFAGLRSAEIERLTWSNVDFKKGFITVGASQAKTRARRLIPIHSNLVAWLADYQNEKGLVWKGTHDGLYDAQQDCAAATAIAADPEKSVKAVAPVAWKANGLRHSYCSYRMAEISDASKVSLEAGNSPNVIFSHYRALVSEDDAKAWFGILPAEQPSNILAITSAVES